MKVKLKLATRYLDGLRLFGSRRSSLIVSRLKAYSKQISKAAAIKLIDRLRQIPENDEHNKLLDLPEIVAREGLELIAEKRLPSFRSLEAADKLGLAFVDKGGKSYLATEKEALDLEKSGIARRLPSPRVFEMIKAHGNIKRIIESGLPLPQNYFWAQEDPMVQSFTIKTPPIEIGFDIIDNVQETEFSLPLSTLYKISSWLESPLKDKRLKGSHISLMQMLDMDGYDTYETTIIEAFVLLPMQHGKASEEERFKAAGLIMTKCNGPGKYLIMVRNNGEFIEEPYEIFSPDEIDVVMGNPVKEEKNAFDLLPFEPIPAENWEKQVRSDPELGRLLYLALPIDTDYDENGKEIYYSDTMRGAVIFDITFVGVSRDTNALSFYNSLYAMSMRDKTGRKM